MKLISEIDVVVLNQHSNMTQTTFLVLIIVQRSLRCFRGMGIK